MQNYFRSFRKKQIIFIKKSYTTIYKISKSNDEDSNRFTKVQRAGEGGRPAPVGEQVKITSKLQRPKETSNLCRNSPVKGNHIVPVREPYVVTGG